MVAWNWKWVYSDPKSFVRSIAPGYHDGLLDSTGTTYAKIQPPVKGVGPLWFRTDYKLYVRNPNFSIVRVRSCLGVGSVIAGPKPMYPYLGVAHGQEWQDPDQCVSLGPGDQTEMTGFRLDIVDNALQSDQPIPNWPNWSMASGQLGQPPFVLVQFFGDSMLPVEVRGLFMQAQAWQ